jgi:ADP-ribosylglycohydrolase
MEADPSEANLRHLLYYVYGNGLESIDCFTVAMAVFLAKGKDVFGALKLCASLGGDTDTVGALVGALIMGVLNNGMSLMGLSQNLQQVVKGLVLLLAVAMDVLSKQNVMANFRAKRAKAAAAAVQKA